MADNALKHHAVIAIDNSARQRANDADQLLGKELPVHVTKVSGQIVTVAFDVKSPFNLKEIDVPIDTSVYDWLPVQVNDKGVVRTADVYLGGVSGLGTGTADLSRRSNLSMLVFHPVTNKQWQPPGGFNQNDRIIQSVKKGVALIGKDSNGNVKTTLYVDDQGNVVIHGNIILTGDVKAQGEVVAKTNGANIHLSTHTHDGVLSGGDDTSAPNSGT